VRSGQMVVIGAYTGRGKKPRRDSRSPPTPPGAFWLFGTRFPLSNRRTPRTRLLRRLIFAFSILRRTQSSS
jgi:hypothetical protein